MRSTLFYISLTSLASCIACDEGAMESGCAAGKTKCNDVCQPSAFYCPTSSATTGTTMGGASSVSTTITYVDPGEYTNADCTDKASLSGTFSTAYAGANITADGGKGYYLHTNWWNAYDGQTVSYQGLSFTVKNPNDAKATDNNPLGYPSLYIGSYSGHTTASSNLPKSVSSLTTVPTVFSTNAIDNGIANHNAAYDVWFTDTAAPLGPSQYSPPAGGAFLMVWLFKPTSRQPRGSVSSTGSSIIIPGVDGKWDVWVDPSSPPCISYVSTTPRNGLSFDLNAFIKESVTSKRGITNSMYLSVIFAGFEVWSGADGVQVKNFCANVR